MVLPLTVWPGAAVHIDLNLTLPSRTLTPYLNPYLASPWAQDFDLTLEPVQVEDPRTADMVASWTQLADGEAMFQWWVGSEGWARCVWGGGGPQTWLLDPGGRCFSGRWMGG